MGGIEPMIAVKLRDPRYTAGPATVVRRVSTVEEYRTLVCDRDGAIDPTMRLWCGDYDAGTEVSLYWPPGEYVTRVGPAIWNGTEYANVDHPSTPTG